MNFFRDVVSHLLKNAFEGHTKFSVADNTAVGANPIRSISLDAVPTNDSTIISLSWDGGEKLFEKNLSEQEASHQFDLISTDLAEVAALTKQGQYDAAKDLMKKLGQKYAENTGDIVDTNLPKLHNTQASAAHKPCPDCGVNDLLTEDEVCLCGCHGKNKDFESSQDVHLWRTAKITMQNLWFSTTDELLEYQQKQKGAKPGADQDHIPLWDKMNKEKTPAAKDELAPPSLSYEDVENQKEKEHDDMQKHIDEKIKTELESALQEKAASVFGPDQVELVKVLRKNGRNWDEIKKILIKDFNFDKDATTIFVDEQRQGSDPTGIEVEPVKEEPKTPLTPPEELVSPETHDKLLQDHEDKKKIDSPIKEDKEPGFSPKEIMDIPEDEEIEKVESLSNEIARADNDDIHKIAAPTDLNPLQEPIKEEPTTPTTPPQDVVPMGKPLDHNAPQKGDRVFVSSDLTDEKAGFEATFISTYKSKGIDFSIVETDDGDLIDIESHRVVKTSEGSGAQDTEPVMEPTIETPKEQDIPVTPKMDDFHTSAQDSFLALKIEAEALLKEVNDMGKTSYMFVKKGLEKHAGDSAFEANGWTRVWVDESEIEVDPRYAEALKLPDENARIGALKGLAREIAQDTLSTKANAGGDIAQMWFDSLKPSDHDRIDWVKLANPQVAESSLKEAADGSACIKCNKVHKLEDMVKNEHGAGYLCKADAPAWNKDASLKQSKLAKDTPCLNCPHFGDDHGNVGVCIAKDCKCKGFACEEGNASMGIKSSDFEKGISQNKTSDKPKKPHTNTPECSCGGDCAILPDPIAEGRDVFDNKQSVNVTDTEPVLIDLIMAYEDGSLDDAGILKLFSELIKSGQAWSLQGSYGRTAKALIDAGYINEKGTITKDVVDTELAPEQNLLESKYSFKNMKTAADPTEAPKTQFKDYKITPKYTPKEQAVPATPEMDDVLTKIDSLQSNLATLEAARKQIQAKMKEELTKIDDQGERAQMEAALQESIEKAAVLLSAMDNKVVQWKDKLFTLQTEEIKYVPSLTPKEMLAKIYAKFEGAEKYVQDVLNGMLSLGKNVIEKTLVRWPNKKSSIVKEANILDDMNHYNDELLAALKELSSPL